ncbi:MAG: DNA polymerase III subunit gamma/tau [Myxococcota bacterium]
MSYVVLARKYRPMRFADMIGQEHIGRTLGNAIKQDRVHHGYLFAGARGLGKTTTARIFAKGLVCEKGPTPEPCNVCAECLAVSESRSVDVVEVDGASNNSVDNIRNLREQVNYLPQTARRKVYIIDEVHMLTTSAFNALLKTLEEPPAHVNFVFATTEPQKVLPTILSRVNRLDFKRVSPPVLVEYLRSILEREGLSVEEGGLRIVARAGGGSVRDALTLLDQVIAFAEDAKAVGEDEVRRLLGQADAGAVHELVAAILDRDATATMQRFDALVTAGNDLSVLGLQVLEHLRDLAVVRVCHGPEVLPDATEAEIAQLQATAGKVDASHLGQLFDRFSRVIDRLPQSRTQRLLIEMGLLDLACAEPVIPLGDLVDRLHSIGRGAPPPGGGGGRGGPARGPGRGAGSGGGRSRGAGGRSFAGADAPRVEPVERAPQPRAAVEPPASAGAPPMDGPPPGRGFDGPPQGRGFDGPPPGRGNDGPPPGRGFDGPPQGRGFDGPPQGRGFDGPPQGRGFDGPPPGPGFDGPPQGRGFDGPPPGRFDGPPGGPGFDGPPPGPGFDAPPQRGPSHATPPGPNGASFAPSSPPSPSVTPAAAPPAPAAAPEPAKPKPDDNSFTAKLMAMAATVVRAEPEPGGDPRPEPPPPAPAAAAAAPGPNGAAPNGKAGAPKADEAIRMGVGPCLPPPPADGVLPWEELEPFQAWEQLLARIRQADEFLAAVLGGVGLMTLAGGALRVAAPRGSFAHTELTKHPQMRAALEQAMRDHLGAPFTVELIEGEPYLPDLPSVLLVVQQRRAAHRAEVEAEAHEHPGIQSVLRTFGGMLLSTKPVHDV